ncbi:tectonic-1-like [Portunus trituberculatus]|uniref:tectonic-1-like n=1 Tax=Portunus trituberculatus TaxID=210409 RepID=UPI001E1CFE34|nr:tectonic-1-like [Portunus trituberculatus]
MDTSTLKHHLLFAFLFLLFLHPAATTTTTTTTAVTTTTAATTTPSIDTTNMTTLDYIDYFMNSTDIIGENETITTTMTPTTTAAADGDDDDDGDDKKEDLKEELFLGDFCLCDLKVDVCDVNCCCDTDCSASDRLAFSHCLPRPSPTPEHRYCLQHKIVFSSTEEYKVEVDQGGLTCVLIDNLPHHAAHTPVKVARTLEEFEALQRRSKAFPWPETPLQRDSQDADTTPQDDRYNYGDSVWGYESDGVVVKMGLPTAIIGSECQAQEDIQYLQDTRTACSRVLQGPKGCHAPELSASTYLTLTVLSGAPTEPESVNTTEDLDNTTTTPPTLENTTTIPPTTPDTPAPTPEDTNKTNTIEITPYLCQTETNGEETCTEVELTDLPTPTYTNSECTNTLHRLDYIFIHNGVEGMVEVRAMVRLGNTSVQGRLQRQEFSAKFVWEDSLDEEVFERSGRPGYVFGKPLLLGRVVENVTEEGEVRSAISLDLDPTKWLTVLSPGSRGHCHSRTQVKFGIDMRSSCSLEVTQDDLGCDGLRSQILGLLLGSYLGDLGALRIGSYGDANVVNVADWVPILVPVESRGISSDRRRTSGCQSIIKSVHLEIFYSLQGALHNPQAKIIAVVLRLGPPQIFPMIQKASTTSSSFTSTFSLELFSTVAFVEVKNTPLPAYARPPSLDIKLPYDFFYPFLPSSACVCVMRIHLCVMCLFCVLFVV